MLSASRKASLQKAAEKFQASHTEASWGYLLARGFTEEMVEQYSVGLVSDDVEPLFEPYIGRLAIPFLTPTGVVSIRYRCIEDHDCVEYEKEHGFHKKYLQMGKDVDHIYNVGALHERHPAIAICEGEIDAMFVDTHVLPAIGVPGATKWKPYWTRLMEDYEKVFVIGDGDGAGRKFCDKLMELLPNAQPVIMPADLDCNSFYLERGADELGLYILGDAIGT